MSMTDLAAACNTTLPLVSHHVAKLGAFTLVSVTPIGRLREVSIRSEWAVMLLDLLDAVEQIEESEESEESEDV